MSAVKAYYDDQRRARVAAVERDIAREREREDEDEDENFVGVFLAEDKKNQTLIDQQHTRHFVEGASWDNHYDIQGAGALDAVVSDQSICKTPAFADCGEHISK